MTDEEIETMIYAELDDYEQSVAPLSEAHRMGFILGARAALHAIRALAPPTVTAGEGK